MLLIVQGQATLVSLAPQAAGIGRPRPGSTGTMGHRAGYNRHSGTSCRLRCLERSVAIGQLQPDIPGRTRRPGRSGRPGIAVATENYARQPRPTVKISG
jgi:hypothetical protein